VQEYLENAIQQHALPSDFRLTVENWYHPLARKIAQRKAKHPETLVLGVQGTQGSGKSTLADFLRLIFEHEYQFRCVSLSIDDFYLTRSERLTLAEKIHPLLSTRGVPGTHDVVLLKNTLLTLKQLSRGESCDVVRFDKAVDDRAPTTAWSTVQGPVDIIIFEGWCVGIPPETEDALVNPCNELEALEDANAAWRTFVNDHLASDYQALFGMLDCLAVLKAPSFDCVYQWRLLQEQKLAAKIQQSLSEAPARSHILSPEAVKRFISHYQRLTEHALTVLPQRADWTLHLNADHQITDMTEIVKA